MINTSVWGSKDKWIEMNDTINSGIEHTGVYTTNWGGGDNTYTTGLGYGVFYTKKQEGLNDLNPAVPLDSSNVIWGVGRESMFMNLHTLLLKGTAEEPQVITKSLYSDNTDFPIRLAVGGNGLNALTTNYFGKNFDWRGRWEQPKDTFGDWDYGDMTSSSSIQSIYNTKLVNEFDYSKIVMVVLVYASREPQGSTSLYDLDEYFDKYSESEPYIRQIILRAYCANGKTSKIIRNRYTLDLHPVINKKMSWSVSLPSTAQGVNVYQDYISYLPCSYINSTIISAYQYLNGTEIENYEFIRDTSNQQFFFAKIPKDSSKFSMTVGDVKTNGERNITFNYKMTKEEILKEVAFLGFWFTGSEDTAKKGVMGVDENLYLPKFNSDGVTTGEYSGGTDTKLQDNFKWTNDIINDSIYKVPNIDFGDLKTNTINGQYKSVDLYIINETQLNELLTFVNGDNLNGLDGIKYIQQLIYYPSIPLYHAINSTTIKIKGIDTGVSAISINSSYGYHDIFSSYVYRPYFNDFRDFEPYTKIELYTIFGSVELSPSILSNRRLSVRYFFDHLYGAGGAFIFVDECLQFVIQGNYGIKIPLFADMAGSYQNDMTALSTALTNSKIDRASTAMTTVGGYITMAAGAFLGNPALIVAGGTAATMGSMNVEKNENNVQQLIYQIDRLQPELGKTSSLGLNLSVTNQFIPKIVISRPSIIDYDEESYANTIGYACLICDKLKNVSGFTICENVDVSGIQAPAQVQSMIQTVCKNGIYL